MFNSLSINPNIKKESSWVPRIYLLDPSSQKTLPGGQQEQGHWVVLQVQEEDYESSLSFRRRVE